MVCSCCRAAARSTCRWKSLLRGKKVLIAVTGHARFGKLERATGYWLEEVAHFYVVVSGRVITGQNPASTDEIAKAVLSALGE